MNLSNKNMITLISLVIIGLLIAGIFSWARYLNINGYIRECFTSNMSINTNNINLPINTTQTCKNMCGPLGKCSITGGQCISDGDCYGCRELYHDNETILSDNLVGDNDSGKSTGTIPESSTLTSDFTANSQNIGDTESTLPMHLSYRVNVWKDQYNSGVKLFDERYKEPSMQIYRPRLTMSGEFIDDGPFASNA